MVGAWNRLEPWLGIGGFELQKHNRMDHGFAGGSVGFTHPAAE